MAATAFWPNSVLPDLEEANSKVEVLTVEFPTLEAVLSKQPDFVAAMLVTPARPRQQGCQARGFRNARRADLPVTQRLRDHQERHRLLWQPRKPVEHGPALPGDRRSRAGYSDVADRGEALIADFKAREAALFAPSSPAMTTSLSCSGSPAPRPPTDAYLGGGNGPSGYIADVLGGSNAIQTEADWPTLGWEGIMAAEPKVIVVAQVDRNRWDLDKAENKIAFLTSDPTVSQMEAVSAGRIRHHERSLDEPEHPHALRRRGSGQATQGSRPVAMTSGPYRGAQRLRLALLLTLCLVALALAVAVATAIGDYSIGLGHGGARGHQWPRPDFCRGSRRSSRAWSGTCG